MQNATPLLAVRGLRTVLRRRDGSSAPVIDDVAFSIAAGETLALVGESGSGKSVTALSVMRLLPDPPMAIEAGTVELDGVSLTTLSESRMCGVRGGRIGMIFQDPMSSLNPVQTIGDQVGEVLRVHRGLGRRAARAGAQALLEQVRLPDAPRRLDDHPHRLSGGMRQRVMIAMAIAGGPRLLIADEPTTALDVTVEAQIMTLLARLREDLGPGLLLITHNFRLVAQWADRVAVMYAGRIVETGVVRDVLRAPLHPYTRALLGARPGRGGARLEDIPGRVPAPGHQSPGCAFADRCRFARPACSGAVPPLEALQPGHLVACLRSRDVVGAA